MPLLLAASGVMVLLAGTAVMLVIAMLQRPEPAAAAAVPMLPPSTMVAPTEALPAPVIAAPEVAEVDAVAAPAPAKRSRSNKAPSILEVEPAQVTVTAPAIQAPEEPVAPVEAAPQEEEKKKKGLFGKKKDR